MRYERLPHPSGEKKFGPEARLPFRLDLSADILIPTADRLYGLKTVTIPDFARRASFMHQKTGNFWQVSVSIERMTPQLETLSNQLCNEVRFLISPWSDSSEDMESYVKLMADPRRNYHYVEDPHFRIEKNRLGLTYENRDQVHPWIHLNAFPDASQGVFPIYMEEGWQAKRLNIRGFALRSPNVSVMKNMTDDYTILRHFIGLSVRSYTNEVIPSR